MRRFTFGDALILIGLVVYLASAGALFIPYIVWYNFSVVSVTHLLLILYAFFPVLAWLRSFRMLRAIYLLYILSIFALLLILGSCVLSILERRYLWPYHHIFDYILTTGFFTSLGVSLWCIGASFAKIKV